MNISCIIPARGGSKRIPNKNAKLLNGKPLILYTVETALQVKEISNIYVDTDSDEIINVVKDQVNIFRRPKYLATDVALTEDVVRYALYHIGECDYVLVLYPTSPFRKTVHVNALIKEVLTMYADSGQTISKLKIRTGKFNSCTYTYDERSMQQDMKYLDPIYVENSGAYLFKPKVLLKTRRMQGKFNVTVVVDHPYDLDINDKYDWCYAEALLEKGLV